MRSITFWQNVPSIHQAPMIRALADLVNPTQVRVVTDEPLSPARAAQGWSVPDFGGAELIVAPTTSDRSDLISRLNSGDDAHVCSGFRAYPGVRTALVNLLRTKARLAVFAEAGRIDDGPRALLRQLLYRADLARFRDRVDVLLATGELGRAYFARAGFPVERIRRFAYFTELPNLASFASAAIDSGAFSIAFVGAHIHRKRLDLLLGALHADLESPWHLTIVGTGELTAELKAHAASTLGNDRVTWLGTLPNVEMSPFLAYQDVLVLPSSFDGWGAVVNEALSVGTPVIASDACGASDLLVNGRVGDVFRSGDEASLADALRRRMAAGRVGIADRAARATWASAAIGPRVGAQYLFDVLDGRDRPVPPWEEVEASW